MNNTKENIIIAGVKALIDNGLSNIPGYNFLKIVFTHNQDIQRKRAEEFLNFLKENEQYSEIKRQHICNIFLGFTKIEDKESFELEKMYHVLNLLSIEDLKILQTISNEISTNLQTEERLMSSVYSLNSVGLFSTVSGFDGAMGFNLTSFGKKFKEYVFQN
jgi:hypothetical protein